ncbi:MAG: DUF5618 family protein [Bacteroidetes bacterium]|nr:DUF5618 family protein [Bacteroidota bacterium]
MSKQKHTDACPELGRRDEYSISEAYRYLANAKETIAKSEIQYGIYTDSKYVREAAGIAYLAAFKAMDVYFISRGFNKAKLPKSIDEYQEFTRKYIPLNGKLNASLKIVYENLHIFAYYRGGTATQMVKEGFENARKVIEMINKLMSKKSEQQNIICEPKARYKKRKKI